MSEYTPLTEAERCLTCESWGRPHCGEHSGRPIPTLLDQEPTATGSWCCCDVMAMRECPVHGEFAESAALDPEEHQ